MIAHTLPGVLLHRRVLWRLALLRFIGWPSEDSLGYLVERSNKVLILDDNAIVAAISTAAARMLLKCRDAREATR